MCGRGLARAAAIALAAGCLAAPGSGPGPGDGGEDGSPVPDAARDDAAGDDAGGPLSEGLVGWFKMDLSPEGGTALDETRNGDGTCGESSCPSFVPGHIGGGYKFDGGDDALLVAAHPALHTESGTAAVWVKIESPAVAGLIGKPFGAEMQNSWLLFTLGDGSLLFENTSGATLTDPGLFALGEWTHLAMTWSGTSSAVFVDGVYAKSAEGGTEFDGNPVVLGADRDDGNVVAPLDGVLDDVRIYDRVLDLAEIEALAAM